MRSQVPAQAVQTSDPPTQISVANRAELDRKQAAQSLPEAEAIAATPQGENFRQNFSHVPVGPSSFPVTPIGQSVSPIQPKLKVGSVGDRYEQEADRVAAQVMRMPGPTREPSSPLVQHSQPNLQTLQRQTVASEMTASEQEDEEETLVQAKAISAAPQIQNYFNENQKLQRQSTGSKEEDEDIPVQAKSMVGQASAAPNLEAQLKNSQGGGHPLPGSTRQFMESRFSHDFSGVRIHSNGPAARMNHGLNAQAFTHGTHIYFGQGQYQPHTQSGQRLLAHELTHVVQQTGDQRIQPKALVQLQARTALIQARRTNKASPVLPPTTEETAEVGEEATLSPEPVLPQEREQPEAEQPTVETEETQAVVSAEGATAATDAIPAETGAIERTDIELLMPEPPSDLSEAAQGRLNQAQNRAGQAAEVTTELPTAEANVGEARGAVEEPQEEIQARAGGALVEALGERVEPSAEIEELCERIRRIIREQRPPDEESLVEADPEEAAREAGNELNQSIEGDVERVEGSYDQLDEPPEGEAHLAPEEIETPPEQVETPDIGAANAVPDEVPPEDVSLDADLEASSARIEEAGLNRAPAQVAAEADPSSPMAEAQAAQGELAETAQRDPAVVLAEQQEALGAASADMAALQETALAALAASRTGTVTGVQSQQTTMVGSEQQTRAQVGQQAQQIFSTAQQQVNALLAPLQQNAMNRWERGKAVLTTRFRQRLARVEQWVDEEYGGVVGSVVKFFTGLPDWVTEEYNRAERDFGDGVCTLIREISVEVNSVVAACEQIIDNARQEIDSLFDNLPQELQEWAATEKEKLTAQLDGLQNQVTQARDELNQNLASRAAESVQEVRQEVHALREAAKGLIGQVTDAINQFLEDPAKFIIEGLLTVIGIAASAFWGVVNRIGQAIDSIAEDPLGFADNLLSAVGQGFQLFFDNIGTHLLGGFIDWLFSGLGAVGIQVPTDLSLTSIVGFFLELMGFTWERIRRLLAKHIGEENIALIEKAFELISNFIEKGIDGIVEMIQPFLNPQSLLDQVIEAAVDFAKETIAVQVAFRILALFNPAGAIVQAVEAIYKVLKWIFENAGRIFSLVETVVGGITQIIAGNISGMATAVELALVRLLVPVIDFVAGFAGLGNLPEKVADTIKGFQEWIESIINRVISFLAERAKGLLRSLGLGNRKDERTDQEKQADLDAGVAAAYTFLNNPQETRNEIEDDLDRIKNRYKMTELSLVTDSEDESSETVHVYGKINPDKNSSTRTISKESKFYTLESNGKRLLREKYRGSRKIRTRFYYSNRPYSDAAQNRRDEIVNSKTDPNDSSKWLERQKSGAIVSVPKTNITIAHDPQVATHWNDLEGKNTNQDTRRKWFTFDGRLGELKVESREENSRNQDRSLKFDDYVGDDFKGPGEE